MRRPQLVLIAIVLALSSSGIWACAALAGGGNYVFDGGTPAEQQQVRLALQASTFNWSIVPGVITITIAPGTPVDEAEPGQIWLDANLLDSGSFSWGVVQHEYAHEVDFELFDAATRALLDAALHGTVWCYADNPSLAHNQYGCERFASTLAWAFWPSAENCMRPALIGGESAALAPAAFRALILQILGPLAQTPSTTVTATFRRRTS
jgi:hypothetical protein